MTSIRKALGATQNGNYAAEIPVGEQVTGWDPDAIGRMYDEAKANIADEAGTWAADDAEEPWPETEEIDVGAIEPPTPSRRSEPASAPSPSLLEAPAARPAPEPPSLPGRPWRAWRRWFTAGTANR